jgi:exopolysaccharide biosynthesis operon protein EpsL
MQITSLNKVQFWYFMSSWAMIMPAMAEGIIDITPSVNASINYDDNIYRFSSSARARQFLGSTDTSDVVKQVGLGVNVNLRLSRQLVNLSSSINKNSFNRFKSLDNTGKANALRWNWQLGNDLNGQLGISEQQAISGFNETRTQDRNLTTSNQKFASLNWNFIPDWSLRVNREINTFENDTQSNIVLDREDEVFETGINYQNQLDTNLGLAYRVVDSSFPNRTGVVLNTFGKESTLKESILTAAWAPTVKTRISTRFSKVTLERESANVDGFSGVNQRLVIDHVLTGKINLNMAVYKNLSQVDDVFSSFVDIRGFSLNPNWNITSKLILRPGFNYEERNYIGTSSNTPNNEDRVDKTEDASLGLVYLPNYNTSVQLLYRGEKRTSNLANAGYRFNSLNLSVNYQY